MNSQNNVVIATLRSLLFSPLSRLIMLKILCLALLVGGVAVAALSLSGAFAQLVEFIPDNTVLRIIASVIVALVGLAGLAPVPRGSRANRVIAYPGERGTVSINLDSVEGSLMRALAKLPEVRKVVGLSVSPTGEQKVNVHAEIVPNKEPSVSMRELGYRLSHRIAEMGEHILGENEVATVDVTFPRLAEATADLPPTPSPAPDAAADNAPVAEAETEVETPEEPGEADGDVEAPEEETPAEHAGPEGEDDDLVLGAGTERSADGDAEEALEEPTAGVDLDIDSDAQSEVEEPDLSEPIYADEAPSEPAAPDLEQEAPSPESPEEVSSSDEDTSAFDETPSEEAVSATEDDSSTDREEEEEYRPGW